MSISRHLLALLAIVMVAGCGSSRSARLESARALVASLPAIYAGTIAADDGPPSGFSLSLRPDGVYLLRTYAPAASRGIRPPSLDELGRWRFGSDSTVILIGRELGETIALSILDDRTLAVGRSAMPLEGDTTGRTLRRVGGAMPLAARLQLRALYSDDGTGRRLRDCSTGLTIRVGHEAAFAQLDSAYRAAGRMGRAMMVHVVGRIEARPRMEVEGYDEIFIVEQFNGALPFETCEESRGEMSDLKKTFWRVVDIGGAAIPNMERPSQVTLEIDSTGTRAGGRGGCNRFGASIEIDGATIRIADIMSTKMACDALDVEGRYFDSLQRVRRWRVSGDRLELLADDGAVLVGLQRWTPER